MAAKKPTFEQVDKLVENYYRKDTLKAGKADLGTILAVAKPILLLVSSFSILPKKWRTFLTELAEALDVIKINP